MKLRKKIVGAFLCSIVTIPFFSRNRLGEKYCGGFHDYASNSTLKVAKNGTRNKILILFTRSRSPNNDVILTGTHDKEAFDQLQKAVGTQLTLTMDQKGKVAYQLNPNQAISEEVSLFMCAMDDHSVIAIINTTDNLSSSVTGSILQGEFQGSTLDTKTGIATAKQEVNVRVLERADRVKGTPGEGMLHEVIEAYNGAKINQRDQIGVVAPALIGGTNPVYQEAHANAPGGQNADEVVYEKNPPAPGQIIYNPATEGCLQAKGVIIQTFPNKF